MLQKKFAQQAAEILIDIGAVSIRTDAPFTLTSGKKSPVYVDCRRIISFPKERQKLMKMALQVLENTIPFDAVAGGETAGIPFAAWISELMSLPMIYVRKKPKGFGQNKRIEGLVKPNQNILLVEDLATDGGSKMSFVNAIREAGGNCTTCFVIFHYGIFEKSLEQLKAQNVSLIELATWKDILDVLKESLVKSLTPIKWKEEDLVLDNPIKSSNNKGLVRH